MGESNKATVMRAFEDWGAGRMCGEGRDAVLAADCTVYCVIDASAAMGNTDSYRLYNGLAGFGEWIDFLTAFDFPDFQVLILSPGADPSKVLVKVSYTPTVKATGKIGPLMSDLQEWTVTGDKVSAVKFYWGNPGAVDALFVDGPTFESNKATVMRAFEDWGAGRMCGEGRDAVLAADCTVDCVIDASAAMKNTDGYRLYNGLAGFGEWIDFLTAYDFPDFQVLSLSPGADPSKLLVKGADTPTMKATGKTGPLMSDLQEWTVTGDKTSAVKFYWGNPAAIDALFA